MREINLGCVLMDNNEVLFNGRSLGFLSKEEIDNFVNFKENKDA